MASVFGAPGTRVPSCRPPVLSPCPCGVGEMDGARRNGGAAHRPLVAPAPAGEKPKGVDQVEAVGESGSACLPACPPFPGQAASGSVWPSRLVSNPDVSLTQGEGGEAGKLPPSPAEPLGPHHPLPPAPTANAGGSCSGELSDCELKPCCAEFRLPSATTPLRLAPGAIAPPAMPKGQACSTMAPFFPNV